MSERLFDDTRGPLLDPLLATGWAMVKGRDAIEKHYKFKNLRIY